MYDDTRSVFARFSGFFLFLIALAVVGFLVFLTVRSARDTSDDTGLAVTTAVEEDQTAKEDAKAAKTNEDDAAAETDEDNAQPTDADENQGVVEAPDDDTGLTTSDDTDDEDPVADEAEDDSRNATDEDEDETPVVARGDRNNNDDLPNTGPGEVAISLFAISLLGAFAYNYNKSRSELVRSMLNK